MCLVFICLLIFGIVQCAALDSPTPTSYYAITVDVAGDGAAFTSANKVEVGTNAVVTLTAEDRGAAFERWEVRGDYDVVEESVTSTTLSIIPKSDIYAIAYFEGNKGVPKNTNTSETSPKTSDVTYTYLTSVLFFSFLAWTLIVAFIVKLIRRSQQ